MSEITKLETSKAMVVQIAQELQEDTLNAEHHLEDKEHQDLLLEIKNLNRVIESIDDKLKVLFAKPIQLKKKPKVQKSFELDYYL